MVVADLQAQHGREARAGVAGHEQVVIAFLRVGVAHQPATLSHRLEFRKPAGQQLVRIDLVPGVPDQPVATKVIDQVQGDGEFHDAEVAGEMGGAVRHDRAQHLADFVGERQQLVVTELAKLRGRFQAGQ